MTKQAAMYIIGGLDVMEEAVPELTGTERRQVCELMQQLHDLTGHTADLEQCREALRQDSGCAWPAPTPESLARSVAPSGR
jgi:hypothetical protein